MCGISGFFSFNLPFTKDHLKTMNDALLHRGPDAKGTFFDGTCGLGHTRLSIIDLSKAANQPFYSQDKRYVIVYNGEVFNYRELARQLSGKLKTQSDTEVILESFIRQHIRSVFSLNGMFAYAIYDSELKELYLFRDRIGVKPLYYYWDEDQSLFAFASELKALVTLPGIAKELNKEAVYDFLHLGYVPAPKSIYRNIFKMPSGSWLKVSREGLINQKYWDVNEKIYDQATQEKITLLNKETEAKAHLTKLLSSSVQYQLISDVPLGVFLSGGIDSSLVASIANTLSNSKIQTFSIGFKESKFNETDYAREVAKHLQTGHEEYIVSIEEAKELVTNLLDVYDEPYADSSAIPTMLVSKMAREKVKAVLTGDGGDELFLGYGSYLWAERLARPFWQNFRKPVALSLKTMNGSRYKKASRLFNYKKKQELASHIFSQEQFLFSKREIDLYTQNLTESSFLQPVMNRVLQAKELQALFDLSYYLQDDLLVKVDRATMKYGLEARVPLLDHRIIEFAINLHPNLRLKNKESKYLLKQVLYNYLPKKLFDRPKQGFAIPLAEWLKKDLKFLLEDYLNENVVNRYGIVKYNLVAEMKKKFYKGDDFFYNRLWVLSVLHQFLTKHF